MVDDIGAGRASASASRRKLGRTLEDYELPPIDGAAVRAHRRPRAEAGGLSYIGVPVHLGLISGDQMIAIADLAESLGGDIRLTRQQNFIVTGVPNEQRRRASLAQLDGARLPARR